MRIVLFWIDFLHYHIARINATSQLLNISGDEIIPIAIRPGSSESQMIGYQSIIDGKVILLSNKEQPGNMNSINTAKRIIKTLQEIKPDAVAIPGYDSTHSNGSRGMVQT